MTRPVTPEEATSLPGPREGVTIRRVASHENGLPVAGDLHLVHEMLEASFEDHFNSYRESFPEFVQRLREDPGHRWDHWWLAFVEGEDGEPLAAGAWSAPSSPENADGHEGSYIEYIGVHRHARGRGVAKALLHAVIADAARRGRDRVGLEVDADSPTGADGLYASMGWETDYVLESWFKELELSVNDPEVIGRRAEQSNWLDHAARSGLVAYGVVYLLLAWLAIQLALGDQSEDASPRAPCSELAKQPFGKVLVWAVALGMLLLVVWRLIEAAFGHREHEGSTRTWHAAGVGGEGRRVRRAGRDRRPGGAGLRELQQLVAELTRDDGEGDGPARRSVDRGGRRSRGHRVRRGRDRPARLDRRSSPRTSRPRASWAGAVRGTCARQGRPLRQGRRPDRSSAR